MSFLCIYDDIDSPRKFLCRVQMRAIFAGTSKGGMVTPFKMGSGITPIAYELKTEPVYIAIDSFIIRLTGSFYLLTNLDGVLQKLYFERTVSDSPHFVYSRYEEEIQSFMDRVPVHDFNLRMWFPQLNLKKYVYAFSYGDVETRQKVKRPENPYWGRARKKKGNKRDGKFWDGSWQWA